MAFMVTMTPNVGPLWMRKHPAVLTPTRQNFRLLKPQPDSYAGSWQPLFCQNFRLQQTQPYGCAGSK